MRRLAVLMALCLLLIPAPTQAKASVGRLNVQLSDLPHGWRALPIETGAGSQSGSDSAIASEIGRGVGPASAFVPQDVREFELSTPRSVVSITSKIMLWTSAAAAHQALGTLIELQEIMGTSLPSSGLRFTVGDERSVRAYGSGTEAPADIWVAFRRDRYVYSLWMVDGTRNFPTDRVLHLAALVDTRVAHASAP